MERPQLGLPTQRIEYIADARECLERGYQISYETPRSSQIQLFHLGERTYDHLVFLPAKVKGE